MWRVIIVSLFIILILFALFVMAEFSIGWGVRNHIQAVQRQFPGDRVEALIAMVKCTSCNLDDRNQAVWALGQLDDPRAIPALEKFQAGEGCNHLTNICQEKLRIALRHLRHEDNNRSEAFLWRWMLPSEKS
jgi:hypothetical protein